MAIASAPVATPDFMTHFLLVQGPTVKGTAWRFSGQSMPCSRIRSPLPLCSTVMVSPSATPTGESAPFWAFCWASGQLLARYVLDHPELVRGRRVLDFGCGSGVVAIAAALAGAESAVACDCDPLALEAARANAALNGVAVTSVRIRNTASSGLKALSR